MALRILAPGRRSELCARPLGIGRREQLSPEIVLLTLDYFINHVDLKTEDRCGFKATFNPAHPDRSKNPFGWVSPWQFGLNQGPIVLMIENYRSGLPWRLMRSCPYATRGLRRAGFTGGWLHGPDGGSDAN